MTINTILIILIVSLAPVVVSYVVEALRKSPQEPDQLSWAQEIPIQYADLDGTRVRYIKTGKGPNLLLLHTLRTQLDIFQKMIPELSKSFTVYAFDYPGHGWSDIPKTDYTADYFVNSVEKYLEKLDLKDVLIAGVSIGGSIPLVIAGKNNNRVKGVISINPYDYPGKGPARGNFIANFIMSTVYIPVLGDTFMRLRNRMIERKILEGGVADPDSLGASFLEEVFVVGERPGHLKAFINLIRHSGSFKDTHLSYKNISVPVLLIYGEKDWAKLNEREQTASEIPGVMVETINNARHFLSLEHPNILNEKIKQFSRNI